MHVLCLCISSYPMLLSRDRICQRIYPCSAPSIGLLFYLGVVRLWLCGKLKQQSSIIRATRGIMRIMEPVGKTIRTSREYKSSFDFLMSDC
jgi:hypothetical protein